MYTIESDVCYHARETVRVSSGGGGGVGGGGNSPPSPNFRTVV